jgi:hypothetical protein
MSEEKLHWVREHETDCTCQPFGDGRGDTLASGYVTKAALNLAQADCVAARRLDGLRVDCQCRRHSASGCATPEDPEWALATCLQSCGLRPEFLPLADLDYSLIAIKF